MSLILEPNVAHPDDMYQVILDMHEGLSDEQSATANAKLILLLANHIGDLEVVTQAAAIARDAE
ncbi:MAG: DUF2783 domain-containing protein [Pseudomonadota bacterium]